MLGYYSTLNLAIELFQSMDLPKYHFERIKKLGELVESAYDGNILDEFRRNDDEPISEEELSRGMVLDSSGRLVLDDEGSPISDPEYSVLDLAKKRSTLKRVKVIEYPFPETILGVINCFDGIYLVSLNTNASKKEKNSTLTAAFRQILNADKDFITIYRGKK